MNKKSLLAWISGIFLMSILPLISALPFDVADILSRGPRDLIDVISSFTSPFFEVLLNTSAYSEFFFAKILLLILVFIIVYYILRQTEFLDLQRRKGIIVIIAAIVSILSMRYLPENDFIKGVLLPYNALGLSIIIFLPFLIYFFFVEKSVGSPPGRRAAWMVYVIVFGVLWITRASEISSTANYIYLAGLIVVILAMIFDSTIHKYFRLEDLRKLQRGISTDTKISLLKKLEDAQGMQAKHPTDPDIKRRVKELKEALRINVEEGEDLGSGI